jgi:hypothetical protein
MEPTRQRHAGSVPVAVRVDGIRHCVVGVVFGQQSSRRPTVTSRFRRLSTRCDHRARQPRTRPSTWRWDALSVPAVTFQPPPEVYDAVKRRNYALAVQLGEPYAKAHPGDDCFALDPVVLMMYRHGLPVIEAIRELSRRRGGGPCRVAAGASAHAAALLRILARQPRYDLRLIRDYLGHRDPKHTVHYTRVAAGRFERLWR